MEFQNEPILIKPIGGTHDLCTYSLMTKKVSENSLDMPRSFCDDYGICTFENGLILIAGGVNQATGSIANFVYLIDANTFEVSETAPLPIKIKGLRIVSYNDEAFSIGGCTEMPDGQLRLLGDCYKFSLEFKT